MIRVFPRRTKLTPRDELAFVGDPPLFIPQDPGMPVRISVAFTWDIAEAKRLQRSWSRFYTDVQIGGPALRSPVYGFKPGRFLKTGAVITSRGCIRQCKHCFVPDREGGLCEIPITTGWNVLDNNLLACSRPHIEAVFDMLRKQPHEVHLTGGLDALLLEPWHVALLQSVRLRSAFFACDYPGAEKPLERVSDLLSDIKRRQTKRCYVLIGFNGESIIKAEERLERVFELGFDPFAMLYRDEQTKAWSKEWKDLQRKWTRPAIYRKKANKRVERTEAAAHP